MRGPTTVATTRPVVPSRDIELADVVQQGTGHLRRESIVAVVAVVAKRLATSYGVTAIGQRRVAATAAARRRADATRPTQYPRRPVPGATARSPTSGRDDHYRSSATSPRVGGLVDIEQIAPG